MKKEIMMLILLVVICDLSLAQKINYDEVLNSTKNIKSAYLNKNSILLKTGISTLKLIDANTKKEKEINIQGYVENFRSQISPTKNGQYFILYSNGEMNHNGMFIDQDGIIKSTFELSTPYAKISSNGKYIITTDTEVMDGGYFQIFNAETLEEYKIPNRDFYRFKADFIDTNRVFLLFNELYVNTKEMKKYVKSNPKKKKESKRKFSTITAKYLIYNISTQEIEHEDELVINSRKYHFADSETRMTISDNGEKVLFSSYLKSDNRNRHHHNRLLMFDLLNYELKDISSKIDHGIDDEIVNISFLNSNYFVSVHNKRTTKYYYMEDDRVFSKKHSFSRHEIGYRYILPKIINDNIVIIDSENQKLIWEYKNNNKISISNNNNYPIFSIDNKIKEIKEVQK